MSIATAFVAGTMALAAFLYYGRLYPPDSPLEDPVYYPFSIINAAGIAWFASYLADTAVRLWNAPDDDDIYLD